MKNETMNIFKIFDLKNRFDLLKITGILLFVLMASCHKVEDLSNYNEIKGFEIISHTPEKMEISGTQVEDDVIYVDINFGEYLFPLYFHAKPIIDGTIDCIVGIDFSKELILEQPQSELVFHVMAQSGLTRPYTIKARVTPLEKNTSLSRFFKIKEIEPEMLISEEGVTISLSDDGIRRDTLKIFTVDGTCPLTITPEFTIAESSKFGEITSPDGTAQTFDNGNTPLFFENVESAYHLKVISESGLENTWIIVIRHAPLISGNDEISVPQQLEDSNINPRTISTQSVHEVFVDNDTEQVLFVLKKTEDEITFPQTVQFSFTVLNGVQILGLDELAKSATVTFNGWDDVKTFYLLDTDACVSRLWTIALKEWKASNKDVMSFGYTYTATTVVYECTRTVLGICLSGLEGSSITLETSQTVIHPSSGDIYLYMTDVKNTVMSSRAWRLTLNNLQITVSEGATLEALPNFVWNDNNSWMVPISFKVTAQDGTEKIWRVNIRDMRNYTPSSGCDLIGLTIARYSPNYAAFDAFTPISINNDQRSVTLKLIDDDGVYPLQVWVSCEVSQYARITSQNGGNDPLIFENTDSEQIITITAEDGTVSNWTVRLQPPPREVRADVLTFQVTSISQGAQLARVTKQDKTGAIRLLLNAATVFPLEITYVMTLSPKATASIPLRGTFTVNSYRDLLSFTVTAQDGSTRNWNARLVYEPQLTNWTLDEWKSSEPVGWATANQAATGTTTQTAGNQGSAVQLKTGSTLGFISSGSLFLGEFNRNNVSILTALTDPISLTFFGIPFKTSGKILGIQADLIYSLGAEYISGTNRETGSCVIELLKPKPGMENVEIEYHGADSEGNLHAKNTATSVAYMQVILGNSPGTAWNGKNITIVSNSAWTTVQVLFDYPNGEMPDFTHLNIVFASSAQGDFFRGVSGSTLKIDNVKILYEEE